MGVHVDDTAVRGHGEVFSKAIAHLRSRFPYSKWRTNEGEFCGAFYRQNIHSKEIHMSQKLFAGKLRPATIPKGADNGQLLSDSQVRVLFLRAINGSLNWISSQSGPDVAVQTSLSQQAFPNPWVRHLRDANNAVRRVKQNKDLEIWFRAIGPTDLTICCHSDAAWANVGSHTQAGYVISFVSKSLNEGKVPPWTPAVWKLDKMSRAVNSTLSGKSQALATASGTAEWVGLMLGEALGGPFGPRVGRELLCRRPPILTTDCSLCMAT